MYPRAAVLQPGEPQHDDREQGAEEDKLLGQSLSPCKRMTTLRLLTLREGSTDQGFTVGRIRRLLPVDQMNDEGYRSIARLFTYMLQV